MLIISGVVQLCLIGYVTIYEYKRKSIGFFLWSTLLVLFGIMHFLTCIANNDIYSEDILQRASLFAIFFTLTYITGRMMQKTEQLKTEIDNNEILLNKAITKVLFLSLLLSVALYAVYVFKFAGSVANISKSVIYETVEQPSIIRTVSGYLYSASCPVILVYLLSKNKKMLYMCIAFVIIRFSISFSRTDMIPIFVAIVCKVIFTPQKDELKNIKTMFILALIAIFALYSFYLIRSFRYYYSYVDIGNVKLSDINAYIWSFIISDNGDLGLRNFFYYLISIKNQYSGLGNGSGYLRLLLLPIPSYFLFGLKPIDICHVIGKAINPFSINYSVTPTLFGDCYANFGFLGFFMGFVWAVIISFLDKIINRKNLVIRYALLCLIATTMINVGRGSVYNVASTIWYSGIYYYVIYWGLKSVVSRTLREGKPPSIVQN